MQNIHTVIRQMFSGLSVDRNDGVQILDRSSLRDDLLVPNAHKNYMRVTFQADMLVHDGLFRLVPRSCGPLHSWQRTLV